MANTSSPRSRRVRIWIGLGMLFAAGIVAAWWLTWPKPHKEVDMTAVLRANSLGVGHIEWFTVDNGFRKAVEAFEEVVRLAPDWEPGKINLGIALMNLARGELPFEETDSAYKRAASLFEDVLKHKSTSIYAAYAHFNLGLVVRWRGDPGEFEIARQHFEAVTNIDDHDAFAWFNLGSVMSDMGEPRERVMECYRNALRFDPYQNAALLAVQLDLRRQQKDAEADALLEEMQALRRSKWETKTKEDKYSERGKYAEVIAFEATQPTTVTS
jgi:tetratricopeptide (TPR) repeat protein